MEKYALKGSRDPDKNSGKNVALKFDFGSLSQQDMEEHREKGTLYA